MKRIRRIRITELALLVCLLAGMCLTGGCGNKEGETSSEGTGISGEIILDETEGSGEVEGNREAANGSGEAGDSVEAADRNGEAGDGSEASNSGGAGDSGDKIGAGAESENEEKPEDLGVFVLYFSGIDVWGWTDIKSRSDVNIIAAVNTNTRHVQLINTPRDYYVSMPISGEMKDKLTHAGLYGVENSMGTLEMLYGIEIDYYLRVNFSGFEAIIDTLGGIDVYSEYDFTVDPIKHYEVGYNHLTGLEALAFVRERHAFADGDHQRGRNQMALIQAMVKKVCSLDFLLNYSEVMDELTDMYRTNIPGELIVSLVVNQLLDDSDWTVDAYSVIGSNGSEKTYSIPNSNTYVMIPNEDDVAAAKQLIEEVLRE